MKKSLIILLISVGLVNVTTAQRGDGGYSQDIAKWNVGFYPAEILRFYETKTKDTLYNSISLICRDNRFSELYESFAFYRGNPLELIEILDDILVFAKNARSGEYIYVTDECRVSYETYGGLMFLYLNDPDSNGYHVLKPNKVSKIRDELQKWYNSTGKKLF